MVILRRRITQTTKNAPVYACPSRRTRQGIIYTNATLGLEIFSGMQALFQKLVSGGNLCNFIALKVWVAEHVSVLKLLALDTAH